MIDLPQEIFTDILLRLPLHLIARCRLVSKHWNDFISDPDFAKAYDINSYSRRRSCSTTLSNRRHGILHCRLKRGLADDSIPMPNSLDTQFLSGPPSKAIACVKSADGTFYLYSLLTGSWFAAVPSPVKRAKFWLLYGFGYDRHADDYKIMVAAGRVNLFWVYSFRNRGWTRLKGFPYAAYDWSATRGTDEAGGYPLKGVLYWAVRAVGGREEVIVTYDLQNNSFGEIAVPTPEDYESWKVPTTTLCEFKSDVTVHLGEFKGQLCLLYMVPGSRGRWVCEWVLKENGGAAESPVWVMKKYGWC